MTGAGPSRLSKIAHMRLRLRAGEAITLRQTSARWAPGGREAKRWSAPLDRRECVTAHGPSSSCAQATPTGYVPFLIVNGRLRGPGWHAKANWNIPRKRFHQSCARCRRSQLPLASSQFSKERTLARARAIEQSAAP